MPPAVAIGSALVGGVAGAFGKKTSQSSDSWVDAGQATGFENQGQQYWQNSAGQLSDMVGAGPGLSDVSAGYGAQKDLAAMYKQYSQGGFLPTGDDMASSRNSADALFAPQEQGLQQSFLDQTQQANRSAAAMGAAGNDPILAAKLRTEQMRQQAQMGAQKGAFSQQLAMSMPGQRLGYEQAHANILGGLATQAMSNRQALAAMGQGIMQNQQNFRLQTATRHNVQETSSGGGIGGAITGAMGGFGVGMSAMAGMSKLGLFDKSPVETTGGGIPSSSSPASAQDFGGGTGYGWDFSTPGKVTY